MVAEHEGMRLWPRFSHVRLPHVGSHAGADQAKGAEAPICRIREDSEFTTMMKNTKSRRAAISLDKSGAHPKEKVMFLRASSLVRGGPDPPQGRRERPLLL